jgi:hypothetical protein
MLQLHTNEDELESVKNTPKIEYDAADVAKASASEVFLESPARFVANSIQSEYNSLFNSSKQLSKEEIPDYLRNKFPNGGSQNSVELYDDLYKQHKNNEQVLQNIKNNYSTKSAAIGASFVAGVLDPVGIVAGGVVGKVLTEAETVYNLTSMMGRAGIGNALTKGVGVSAASGAAFMTPTALSSYEFRKNVGDDPRPMEILTDIGSGAIFGGTIHAGINAFKYFKPFSYDTVSSISNLANKTVQKGKKFSADMLIRAGIRKSVEEAESAGVYSDIEASTEKTDQSDVYKNTESNSEKIDRILLSKKNQYYLHEFFKNKPASLDEETFLNLKSQFDSNLDQGELLKKIDDINSSYKREREKFQEIVNSYKNKTELEGAFKKRYETNTLKLTKKIEKLDELIKDTDIKSKINEESYQKNNFYSELRDVINTTKKHINVRTEEEIARHLSFTSVEELSSLIDSLNAHPFSRTISQQKTIERFLKTDNYENVIVDEEKEKLLQDFLNLKNKKTEQNLNEKNKLISKNIKKREKTLNDLINLENIKEKDIEKQYLEQKNKNLLEKIYDSTLTQAQRELIVDMLNIEKIKAHNDLMIRARDEVEPISYQDIKAESDKINSIENSPDLYPRESDAGLTDYNDSSRVANEKQEQPVETNSKYEMAEEIFNKQIMDQSLPPEMVDYLSESVESENAADEEAVNSIDEAIDNTFNCIIGKL